VITGGAPGLMTALGLVLGGIAAALGVALPLRAVTPRLARIGEEG
jgi:hypothetical protein